MRRIRTLGLAACAALALLAAVPAAAADIAIGRSNEPSALDPHFSRTGNNQMTAQNIFDRLIDTDPNLQVRPALAESWTVVDPVTWEVKLRQGVTFHDGSPLTAEDVVYSIGRVSQIPNSPAPFTGMVGAMAGVEIVDPTTLRFKTKVPTPTFIEQIGLIYIVSKKAAEGKKLEDFNAGTAAIGTGPYKFKEWVPGDRLVLERNDAYWGEKPTHERVTFRFITNDAARVAALRSGSVDVIDAVPPGDVPGLKRTAGINVYSIASGRLIYLALDNSRDESPFVVGADGKPLKPNPLQDRRVRQAMSKMINRQLIIDRVLEGSGEAAGQLAPPGIGGHDPALKPDAYDVDGAKALLAEAGLKDGFGITVHSSNDRFPGDGDLAQALGQMFSRGGLKVNGVVTQPYNVYAAAATRRDFSAFVFSFGVTTPTSEIGLRNVLATYNKEAGSGAFNRVRYSNPAFDAALGKASDEFDPEKRNALLAEATRIAFEDVALIPLYWQQVHWATRGGVTYVANRNEDTIAAYAGGTK